MLLEGLQLLARDAREDHQQKGSTKNACTFLEQAWRTRLSASWQHADAASVTPLTLENLYESFQNDKSCDNTGPGTLLQEPGHEEADSIGKRRPAPRTRQLPGSRPQEPSFTLGDGSLIGRLHEPWEPSRVSHVDTRVKLSMTAIFSEPPPSEGHHTAPRQVRSHGARRNESFLVIARVSRGQPETPTTVESAMPRHPDGHKETTAVQVPCQNR